jgi:hypothetical protein
LQTSNTTYFFIGFGTITLDLMSRFRHVVQLHSFVPFSSCPSSSTNSPFVFKHVDIVTTKINDLIQVPYKKKNKKAKWETEKFFQNTHATKFV